MYLYIIHSQKADKYYVGITNDLKERLLKHNNHAYTGSFTKIAVDWEYKLTHKCQDSERAKSLEKFIKKMKSRSFIEKLIGNPAILDEL